jgi:hypothetical protein
MSDLYQVGQNEQRGGPQVTTPTTGTLPDIRSDRCLCRYLKIIFSFCYALVLKLKGATRHADPWRLGRNGELATMNFPTIVARQVLLHDSRFACGYITDSVEPTRRLGTQGDMSPLQCDAHRT